MIFDFFKKRREAKIREQEERNRLSTSRSRPDTRSVTESSRSSYSDDTSFMPITYNSFDSSNSWSDSSSSSYDCGSSSSYDSGSSSCSSGGGFD